MTNQCIYITVNFETTAWVDNEKECSISLKHNTEYENYDFFLCSFEVHTLSSCPLSTWLLCSKTEFN